MNKHLPSAPAGRATLRGGELGSGAVGVLLIDEIVDPQSASPLGPLRPVFFDGQVEHFLVQTFGRVVLNPGAEVVSHQTGRRTA